MRRIPLLLAVIGIAAPLTGQVRARHPTRAQLVAEVREVLVGLRAAAARQDWDAMSAAFPASGAIRTRAWEVVAKAPGGGGLSFWTPSAVPDFDHLLVDPVRPDIVGISLPFMDQGSGGAFGAVFALEEGQWKLTCFVEAFPARELAPGCVPDLPAPL